MPTCRKCGENIPNHIIIDNKLRNLQNRKFCLICSPFAKHNTRPDITAPLKDRYVNGKRIKRCPQQTVRLFRIRKKQKMIDYKGGKCVICGYNRCSASMHFHHINAADKSFGISDHHAWGFERLKPELDKCVLVCSNCHGELHSGLIDLSKIGYAGTI
jgi:hypothetical protein